jgi:hypothetical protein
VKRSVRRLLLLTFVVGCTAPPGRESLVLRIAMWGPLGELAPTVGTESALASVAQPWVFEKVFSLDATGQLKPGLAARVERLSGQRVRVELRRDATFSDGSPVTEEDVVRSLQAGGLQVIQSGGGLIVAPLDSGLPADALLLEARIFRQSGGKFVGSGPFAVVSQTDTELRLTRRTPQAGHVNDVRVVAYLSSRKAFEHTLKGDANLIIDLESRWLEFFHGVPSLQVIHGTGRTTDVIAFHVALPRSERVELARALESQRVRELAYASGECAESSGTSDGDGIVAAGPVLRVLSWGSFERLALAVRRALGNRGGEVSHLQPQDVLARIKSHDFDLVAVRPLRWPPSAMALVWRTGAPYNFAGYSNPAFDRAVDEGDWRAAESALREDPPAAFVCTRNHLAVADVRIKNPVLGPYDLLETLPEWEIAQ